MEIVQVNQADMLQAINRSEIDMQIATARQYPRNVNKALTKVEQLATIDADTAQECFYSLPRDGRNIEGVSVRLTEIIASCWGNIRVQARIIGNDGKMITAQGVCHDLETNTAYSVEVKRRITDRNGRTFSDDMQVVTGNAACAIACRNAVLKVIPKAVIANVEKRIKQVARKEIASKLDERRDNMVAKFNELGVSTATLLNYMQITDEADIDTNMVVQMAGIYTAIKDGSTTAENVFNSPIIEQAEAEKAKTKAAEAKKRAQQAINKQA